MLEFIKMLTIEFDVEGERKTIYFEKGIMEIPLWIEDYVGVLKEDLERIISILDLVNTTHKK